MSCGFLDGNDRTGSLFQQHRVGELLFLEACKWFTVQINHFEESVLRDGHDEGDFVFAFGAALSRDGDGLHFVLQHAQHTLQLLFFVKRDGGNGAHALRQIVGIFGYSSIETFQRLVVDVNHLNLTFVARCRMKIATASMR